MATELWTCDTVTGLVYRIDASDGTVLQSFAAPDGSPVGVARDLVGDLWVLESGTQTIYRLNPSDGSVLQSFAHPGGTPRGLAFDDNGDLWTGRGGTTQAVYRLDPTDGTVLETIALSFNPIGVAVDAGREGTNDRLWVTDSTNNRLKRVNVSDGSVPLSFDSPSTSPSGIALDGDGDLWHCDFNTDLVYRIDAADGTVLQQFAAPATQPFAMSDVAWIFPVAPFAPTLLDPVDNKVIDAALAYTFDWDFNDPNEGDSQTAYDIRYRVSGTSTWTTVSATSVNTFHQFAGGTFTAGNTYEWQVRTTDTGGLVGPYSASEFFDAADQPSTPTIDAPTLDEVIATENYTVEWTTATQNAYRVRVVGDDGAGNPDTSTVHHDSGIIEVASTRSRSVPFPDNLVTRHVQVQVRYDGLWSDWASVRVTVDYTVPATPTVTLQEGLPASAITVDADHPAPSGTEPTVDSMDVQRSPSGANDWTTIAAGLAPDATYADYAIASDTLYDYRVVAHASSNGTSSTSGPSTGSVRLSGVWLHDPTDPAGTVEHFPRNREGGSDVAEYDLSTNQFAGRSQPVAEFGEAQTFDVDAELQLLSAGAVAALKALVARRTKLLYRDGSGRKVFGVVGRLPTSTTAYGGTARLRMLQVDHDEAVV